jgi:hypothetical protein
MQLVNKNIKYLLVWVLLIGSTQLIIAGDKELFLNDMARYYQHLSKQKTDLSITYKLYNKNIAGNPYQTNNVRAIIDAENKYIDNSQFTFFSNKKYSIVLYKKNKIASLTKTTKSKQLPVSFDQLIPDSTLFKLVTDIKRISDTLGLRTYRLTFIPKSEYKYWYIEFNTQTNSIQTNTVYYKDNISQGLSELGILKPDDAKIKPVLLIQYTSNKWNTPDDFFLANTVIQKKDKKWELTKQYNKYQLYNSYTKVNK